MSTLERVVYDKKVHLEILNRDFNGNNYLTMLVDFLNLMILNIPFSRLDVTIRYKLSEDIIFIQFGKFDLRCYLDYSYECITLYTNFIGIFESNQFKCDVEKIYDRFKYDFNSL
jgi:hypothetical protein